MFFSNSKHDVQNWWIAGNSTGLQITPAWYVFILTYHIITVAQQWIIAAIDKEFRNEMIICAGLLTISFVDFVIGNNDVYARIDPVGKLAYFLFITKIEFLIIPISMNFLCTLVGGFFVFARIFSDGEWRGYK